MKITVNNRITIKDVPKSLLTELKDRLSFVNPKWVENDKRGYWNGETPHTLRFYEHCNGDLILPRGFIMQLLRLCQREDVTFHIEDNRRSLPKVDFQFQGTLRPFQERVVRCQ